MKTKSLLSTSAAIIALSVNPALAQDKVYKLTDLTAEQFASNPASEVWQFEKYAVETGKYSLFTQYTDSNAANYVDIYQPCRVGGERVVQIEGLTEWSNNNTFAKVTRWGWSDYGVYNLGGTANQSKERFCYVTRDESLGYEVYANDEYASVISFLVPEDGFFQMDATVVRQDVPAERGFLSVVPRIRYSTSADKDYANPQFGLCTLQFGQEGGELATYDGNAHIANGASVRYVAQQAEDVSMAFEARRGDIVSFEVNVEATNIHSSWARDYYGRTFYKQLNIAQVDEATARANAHFADTYGESEEVETLSRLVDEYESFMSDVDYGTAFGQYNKDLADQVAALTSAIYEAIENDLIHTFNAASYLEELQSLWRKFLESKVDIDLTAEGNYSLIWNDMVTGEMKCDVETMAKNDDSPWGFYYYEVANGTYHRFEHHGTESKYGSADVSAWYKGTGDWLYIADDGVLHPMTNYAPAIMFTAPKDGVYRVNFSCYRPNPNASVENPLWIRARFMDSETESQDKESFMFAKEYGSVANDGQGGKASITMQYFVNMKQGDKISWEVDCYTSNRNSSAGTQVTALSVCAGLNADAPFTLEDARESGLDVFDAYSVGDVAVLNQAIATAQQVLDAHREEVGTQGGQYSAELCEALLVEIAAATAMAAAGDSEYNIDQQVLALGAAAQAFADSRKPYEISIEGVYAIHLMGTEKYLTQKNRNASGSNFYAAFTDYAGVVADATKNGYTPTDANWTFTFRKVVKEVPTGEYDETTGADITVEVEQTSIYGNGGYVTRGGYVEASDNENAAPGFRFFKQEADDEAFAIMTEDGTYWNGTFSWKSPYDQMNTTPTPNYVFVLSNTMLADVHEIATAVNNIAAGENVIVSTEWYSLAGTRLPAPVQGVCIRTQRMADGSVVSKKVLTK